MAILDPLKVTIENYEELSFPNSFTVPDFPNIPDNNEQHMVALDRIIYIERTDYRQVCFESFKFHDILVKAGFCDDKLVQASQNLCKGE